jgi:hypothetical protein
VALCHRHGCCHPNTVQVTHLCLSFFLFTLQMLFELRNMWVSS